MNTNTNDEAIKEEMVALKKAKQEMEKKLKDLEASLSENVEKEEKLLFLRDKEKILRTEIRTTKNQMMKYEEELQKNLCEICEIEGHYWIQCSENNRCLYRDREEMPAMYCGKCNKKTHLDHKLLSAFYSGLK